ncbi:MAG TPA: hypothetical protein VF054_05790 [Micromonosporaceae bacterium]
MSMYGPPGGSGPYPEPPRHARDADDPPTEWTAAGYRPTGSSGYDPSTQPTGAGYDPPTQPTDAAYGPPTQPTAGPDFTRYTEDTEPGVPAWATPPAPRPKRPTGLIITVAAAVVVLLCGGATAALYLLRPHRPGNAAAAGTPSARPTASPSVAAPSATRPSVNPTDVRAFATGQCVVNQGSEDDPSLRTVACGPHTLKIIARFDGTSDVRKCDSVTGATHHYYYKTTPESLSFVLCFRQQ